MEQWLAICFKKYRKTKYLKISQLQFTRFLIYSIIFSLNFKHSLKKREDSLEESLDRVLRLKSGLRLNLSSRRY